MGNDNALIFTIVCLPLIIMVIFGIAMGYIDYLRNRKSLITSAPQITATHKKIEIWDKLKIVALLIAGIAALIMAIIKMIEAYLKM